MPLPLGDLTALPATTRMLLAADGSTTTLLEALLSTTLTALVDRQATYSATTVPPRLRTHLRTARGGDYIHRHTRLLTPDGQAASSNLVLLPRQEADALLPPPNRPLGRHLTGNHLTTTRQPLTHFRTRWGQEPCVGKDYLIHCRSGARIYVREVFNPDLVPARPTR
ncbi:chorismate-pyruvate lyase [Crossiella equi]|uniref:Chorismate-pyruvate lyase n=3 Tax=Crossiella equi TaxID=130796 RepID=A0ABS5A9P4_9PSEU|nr:chorismate pyruvate-lyase family protein [Crossiella equi]MBP2473291.1 chorismate-pyruvate lyase [Crossiella equi]